MFSKSMNRSLHVAALCGVLPLLVGVLLFVVWVITRWDWLMLGGLFTLYVGLACFIVGVIALAQYCWQVSRAPDPPRQKWGGSVIACAALLISNFPAAGGIVAAVIAIKTCYAVVVRNASQQSISDVCVYGGGCQADFGSIPPGGVARRWLWIQQEGELEVSADIGSKTYRSTLDPYVCPSMGGAATVVIGPTGTLLVSNGVAEPSLAAESR